MIKYGLISNTDARTIEKTIDLIEAHGEIWVTEVGIYSGETGNGIREYIKSKGAECFLTGIDNKKDNEEIRFEYDRLIIGNSNEVYNQIPDNSQHLILIDGNHSFPYVVSDYYCYGDKVKKGGYLCFHDAAPQAQGRDWQRMGDEKDPDMSISLLKALDKSGLPIHFENNKSGWQKIFHEWDATDRCGGMIVFKKLA